MEAKRRGVGVSQFLGRGARIGAPLATVGATMADLASPVAAIAQYAAGVCLMIMLVSAVRWFGGIRRKAVRDLREGSLSKEEFMKVVDSNPWSLTFSFSTMASVILGVFVAAQSAFAEENKGLIATHVPSVEKLQATLFRLEKNLASIQRDLAAMKGQQAYDWDQLKALQKDNKWQELVSHLDDIQPVDRDAEWKALVLTAAQGYTQQVMDTKGEVAASDLAEELIQRYPNLTDSAAYMEMRAKVGLERFRQCYRDPKEKRCYDKMLRFVKNNPGNVELAMEAGRLAGRQHQWREATPFFALALATDKGSKYCEDEKVWHAFETALDYPKHYDIYKAAKKIATGHCWGPMKAEIVEYLELTDDTGNFRDGMCDILREKKALTDSLAEKKGCPEV